MITYDVVKGGIYEGLPHQESISTCIQDFLPKIIQMEEEALAEYQSAQDVEEKARQKYEALKRWKAVLFTIVSGRIR